MSETPGQDHTPVLDHFLNPRNVGDLPDADGVGEVGAVEYSDVLRISIRVRDGTVVEARFRAYGCDTAIACGSKTTELLRGLPVEAARRFSGEQIVKALGGLSATKTHCPALAEEAVKAAVEDYLRRRKT